MYIDALDALPIDTEYPHRTSICLYRDIEEIVGKCTGIILSQLIPYT